VVRNRLDGLESVKKTHQVAQVGMDPSKSAVADLGSDICRIRVNPRSVDAPPAPFQQRPDDFNPTWICQ
jgi:hypothetical protein